MKGVTLYQVRWKGYGPQDDTWEPYENISHLDTFLTDFETRIFEEKSRKKDAFETGKKLLERLNLNSSPESENKLLLADPKKSNGKTISSFDLEPNEGSKNLRTRQKGKDQLTSKKISAKYPEPKKATDTTERENSEKSESVTKMTRKTTKRTNTDISKSSKDSCPSKMLIEQLTSIRNSQAKNKSKKKENLDHEDVTEQSSKDQLNPEKNVSTKKLNEQTLEERELLDKEKVEKNPISDDITLVCKKSPRSYGQGDNVAALLHNIDENKFRPIMKKYLEKKTILGNENLQLLPGSAEQSKVSPSFPSIGCNNDKINTDDSSNDKGEKLALSNNNETKIFFKGQENKNLPVEETVSNTLALSEKPVIIEVSDTESDDSKQVKGNQDSKTLQSTDEILVQNEKSHEDLVVEKYTNESNKKELTLRSTEKTVQEKNVQDNKKGKSIPTNKQYPPETSKNQICSERRAATDAKKLQNTESETIVSSIGRSGIVKPSSLNFNEISSSKPHIFHLKNVHKVTSGQTFYTIVSPAVAAKTPLSTSSLTRVVNIDKRVTIPNAEVTEKSVTSNETSSEIVKNSNIHGENESRLSALNKTPSSFSIAEKLVSLPQSSVLNDDALSNRSDMTQKTMYTCNRKDSIPIQGAESVQYPSTGFLSVKNIPISAQYHTSINKTNAMTGNVIPLLPITDVNNIESSNASIPVSNSLSATARQVQLTDLRSVRQVVPPVKGAISYAATNATVSIQNTPRQPTLRQNTPRQPNLRQNALRQPNIRQITPRQPTLIQTTPRLSIRNAREKIITPNPTLNKTNLCNMTSLNLRKIPPHVVSDQNMYKYQITSMNKVSEISKLRASLAAEGSLPYQVHYDAANQPILMKQPSGQNYIIVSDRENRSLPGRHSIGVQKSHQERRDFNESFQTYTVSAQGDTQQGHSNVRVSTSDSNTVYNPNPQGKNLRENNADAMNKSYQTTPVGPMSYRKVYIPRSEHVRLNDSQNVFPLSTNNRYSRKLSSTKHPAIPLDDNPMDRFVVDRLSMVNNRVIENWTKDSDQISSLNQKNVRKYMINTSCPISNASLTKTTSEQNEDKKPTQNDSKTPKDSSQSNANLQNESLLDILSAMDDIETGLSENNDNSKRQNSINLSASNMNYDETPNKTDTISDVVVANNSQVVKETFPNHTLSQTSQSEIGKNTIFNSTNVLLDEKTDIPLSISNIYQVDNSFMGLQQNNLHHVNHQSVSNTNATYSLANQSTSNVQPSIESTPTSSSYLDISNNIVTRLYSTSRKPPDTLQAILEASEIAPPSFEEDIDEERLRTENSQMLIESQNYPYIEPNRNQNPNPHGMGNYQHNLTNAQDLTIDQNQLNTNFNLVASTFTPVTTFKATISNTVITIPTTAISTIPKTATSYLSAVSSLSAAMTTTVTSPVIASALSIVGCKNISQSPAHIDMPDLLSTSMKLEVSKPPNATAKIADAKREEKSSVEETCIVSHGNKKSVESKEPEQLPSSDHSGQAIPNTEPEQNSQSPLENQTLPTPDNSEKNDKPSNELDQSYQRTEIVNCKKTEKLCQSTATIDLSSKETNYSESLDAPDHPNETESLNSNMEIFIREKNSTNERDVKKKKIKEKACKEIKTAQFDERDTNHSSFKESDETVTEKQLPTSKYQKKRPGKTKKNISREISKINEETLEEINKPGFDKPSSCVPNLNISQTIKVADEDVELTQAINSILEEPESNSSWMIINNFESSMDAEEAYQLSEATQCVPGKLSANGSIINKIFYFFLNIKCLFRKFRI